MRHLKGLVIGISVLALLGCAAQQNAASSKAMPEADEMASMEGLPTLVDQIGGDFYVYDHDGRYYVIGSAEMAKKFKGSGHLPYTHTLIGIGPHGRTIIFEVVKKKPELWSACKRCMRAPPTWWQGRGRIILCTTTREAITLLAAPR